MQILNILDLSASFSARPNCRNSFQTIQNIIPNIITSSWHSLRARCPRRVVISVKHCLLSPPSCFPSSTPCPLRHSPHCLVCRSTGRKYLKPFIQGLFCHQLPPSGVARMTKSCRITPINVYFVPIF